MDVNNSPTITSFRQGIARNLSLLYVSNRPMIGSSLRHLYWLHSTPCAHVVWVHAAYMGPSHCQSTLCTRIVRVRYANRCYSTYCANRKRGTCTAVPCGTCGQRTARVVPIQNGRKLLPSRARRKTLTFSGHVPPLSEGSIREK